MPDWLLRFITRHPWWSSALLLVAASTLFGGWAPALAGLLWIGGTVFVALLRIGAKRQALAPTSAAPNAHNLALVVPTATRVATGPRGQRQPREAQPSPSLAEVVSGMTLGPQLELEEQIEAAGEQFRVKAIRRVFKEAGKPITEGGSTLAGVKCVLLPEPWNSHDPNAVAIMVGPHHVGYIPADESPAYSAALIPLAQRGLVTPCEARIWAKSDGGVVRARVTVIAPDPEEISLPDLSQRTLAHKPPEATGGEAREEG